MKLFEVTIRPDGITIRHEAEECLTAAQKCSVILSVIACTAFLGFVALVTRIYL